LSTTPSSSRAVWRSRFWACERDAELAHFLGFRDDTRRVQQCFRRNAADVQAHAAQHRVTLDQHHLLAEIGGAERGGVAAGAGTQNHHFGVNVAFRDRSG